MLYYFEPHVPGEFGDKSIVDHRFEPFKVYHLDMVFDFTPDDFCQSFPLYFVSEKLLNKLIDSKISGFDNPRLITHEQNEQSPIKYNNTKYFMIDILNDEKNDMFKKNGRLYINEKVNEILKGFNIRLGQISLVT